MDFYEYLEEVNLKPAKYDPIPLIAGNKIFSFLDDIIKNNRKVLVVGDPDVDGLGSILIVKNAFEQLGFHNFDMFPYVSRDHRLNDRAVNTAIENKYDYIFICDTASSEMEKIMRLDNFGVKSIIIDHHYCVFDYQDYPDSCAICNSIIENRLNSSDAYLEPLTVSAGALTFIVFDQYGMNSPYGVKIKRSPLACLALVTLYSDCIDMSPVLNRGLYAMAMETSRNNLPIHIRAFLNEYTFFSRRFIEFNFAPKLNAAFRSERFDYINVMLTGNTQQLIELSLGLSEIHTRSSELVNALTDIIVYDELDNYVIGNLNSVNAVYNVEEHKLYNYTGLIANKLSNICSKPAIVLCNCHGHVKGSFRCFHGGNYLDVFRMFSNSNGHQSAFGILLNRLEEPDFRRCLKILDKKKSVVYNNEPIVIDHYDPMPNIDLFTTMAKYNEFSGTVLPVSLVRLRITTFMKEYKNEFGYNYKWGKMYIKSRRKLPLFTDILARPVLTNRVSLRVD